MGRKIGFAVTAIDPRTGKRRLFPKRFRKKTTATSFVTQENIRTPRFRRRVVKIVGQRKSR